MVKREYYDPELGRFISPDPFLDGLNRYAYCRNNPVTYIDPTGNLTIDKDGNLIAEAGGSNPDLGSTVGEYEEKQESNNFEESRDEYIRDFNPYMYQLSNGNWVYRDFDTLYWPDSFYSPIDGKIKITAGDYYYDAYGNETNTKHYMLGFYAVDYLAPIGTPVKICPAQGPQVFDISGSNEPQSWDKGKSEGIKSFVLPVGTRIAEVGLTGLTTGPHLHRELRHGWR